MEPNWFHNSISLLQSVRLQSKSKGRYVHILYIETSQVT